MRVEAAAKPRQWTVAPILYRFTCRRSRTSWLRKWPALSRSWRACASLTASGAPLPVRAAALVHGRYPCFVHLRACQRGLLRCARADNLAAQLASAQEQLGQTGTELATLKQAASGLEAALAEQATKQVMERNARSKAEGRLSEVSQALTESEAALAVQRAVGGELEARAEASERRGQTLASELEAAREDGAGKAAQLEETRAQLTSAMEQVCGGQGALGRG
jgi:hypothetical protein